MIPLGLEVKKYNDTFREPRFSKNLDIFWTNLVVDGDYFILRPDLYNLEEIKYKNKNKIGNSDIKLWNITKRNNYIWFHR